MADEAGRAPRRPIRGSLRIVERVDQERERRCTLAGCARPNAEVWAALGARAMSATH